MHASWERFKADAARWIIPEQIGDPQSLGILSVLSLMRRHRQLRAVAWFRFGNWGQQAGIRGLSWFVDQRLQGAYGLDLPVATEIGGGLYIAHPTSVAITAERIGENVSVVGAITIGVNGTTEAPTIGDDVYIGAGARVLGAITVGNDVLVGANAVVLNDVPDGLTVVGAPAKPTQASLAAVTANKSEPIALQDGR